MHTYIFCIELNSKKYLAYILHFNYILHFYFQLLSRIEN